MAERLVGADIAPPDLRAKITGRARYAEDFRAPGMVFMKMLLSPMPHCRVRGVDASRALALDGVIDILRATDVGFDPESELPSENMLTDEPKYEGEPILAIAAVDEETAAAAIELIDLDLEPLPFVLDPLDSLRPGGPNPYVGGNQYSRGPDGGWVEYKWTQAEFDAIDQGEMPNPQDMPASWEKGDVEAAFAEADYIIMEPIVHQSVTHHPMEPRSTMAYWENGRPFTFVSTQSAQVTMGGMARALDVDPQDLTFVSEFTGGGFGSKIPGHTHMALAPTMSRKIGRPVMHRITRYEENYIGRARPGFQAWAKMGFRSDGRMTALDLIIVQESGAYGASDYNTAPNIADLTFQPENMRFRGIAMYTNTPPKAAQRGPGGAQIIGMLEPLHDQAMRDMGLDRLQGRLLNSPENGSTFGPRNTSLTSIFAREALSQGAEAFDWATKSQLAGRRQGSKVTGVGFGLSPYTAGSRGYDGLMVIRPDGRLYVYQGVGNLGTHSVSDTVKPGAELLGLNWDQVEVIWGDSSRGMPRSSIQAGSQTTHAHTRANYAAAEDALRKIRLVASRTLGGSPNAYNVDNGRVSGPGGSMSFAQVAERAIALGGELDGSTLPDRISDQTVPAAQRLAGQGLMGVATDNYGGRGSVYSWQAGFAMIELDVETGVVDILEYVGWADCGTVIHPRSLHAQELGGSIQGMGMAMTQRWVFDRRYGVPFANRLYTARPPGFHDVPLQMTAGAVNIPDPETPIGARGIGEPSVGAGSAALACAIADAIGRCVCRTPLTPDVLLSEIEGRPGPWNRIEQLVG